MRWAAVAAPDLGDLILFDGDCVLCSGAAHFVHKRDRAQRFKFVAIQSGYGRVLGARFGIDADAPETNAAVVDGLACFKAEAALSVLAALPGWRWARIANALPRPARNWIYDRIARNRYRLFGRRDRCWAGDPALAARIVERAP
ncbi:thiol-disulfide oxidoreductase DCC family protein [Terricaulis sp.]|uniref:thiol-disulfide oxidoreductase DCC family protein n=1 Tax=Terricaulis sp. TaxID=2768686 RepID=UPI0037834D7D